MVAGTGGSSQSTVSVYAEPKPRVNHSLLMPVIPKARFQHDPRIGLGCRRSDQTAFADQETSQVARPHLRQLSGDFTRYIPNMGPHKLVTRDALRHKDGKSGPIVHIPGFRDHKNAVARVLVPQSRLLLRIPVRVIHDRGFKRENCCMSSNIFQFSLGRPQIKLRRQSLLEPLTRVVLVLGIFRGNVRHFPQIVPLVLTEVRVAFQDLLQRVERRLTRQRRPIVIKCDVDRPSVNPYRF